MEEIVLPEFPETRDGLLDGDLGITVGEGPSEDISRLLRNGLAYHVGVSAESRAEIMESDPTVKSFFFFFHPKACFSERDLVPV